MADIEFSKKKVAKNTLVLYARMILLMLVSLYTSRVVLNALGVVDYGIYSAVGGFVATLGIVTNSLTAAISRFVTYELGRGKKGQLQDIFVASIKIELVLALIVVVIMESGGVWFLNNYMNIPSDRLDAANYVLQFSLATFAFSLLNVPFNALIIAHECMTAFAYIGIFQALGSLSVALLIGSSPINKLVFYSFLVFVVNLIVFIIYCIYTKRAFPDCKMKLHANKSVVKKIFSFAGWNFIGASSGVLRDQGVNILINIFCGPAVNAARGIAMQINSAVAQFASNFLTAINPQITKSYASGEREYMMSLIFQGSRFTVYLLSLISIPIMFETETILTVWLKIVPDYTVLFVRLVLIYQIVEAISYTMVTLMLATGNTKKYQLIVGGCQMLNFPLAFVALKLGAPPEYTLVISIGVAILCLITRLHMLAQMEGLVIKDFIQHVILNVILVYVISSALPFCITEIMPGSILRLFVVGLCSVLGTIVAILYVGCTHGERELILSKVKGVYGKIKSRFQR